MKLFGLDFSNFLNKKEDTAYFVRKLPPPTVNLIERKISVKTHSDYTNPIGRVSRNGAGYIKSKNSANTIYNSDKYRKKKAPSKTTEPLVTVNNRWQNMMNKQAPLREKKVKRSITFNEIVVCHPIHRVTDLMEAYDAFDGDGSEYGTEQKELQSENDIMHEISLLDLAICDINANCEGKPLPRTASSCNLLLEDIQDDESIASLRTNCRTPDLRFPSNVENESVFKENADHLEELENLLDQSIYKSNPPILESRKLENRTSEITLSIDDNSTLSRSIWPFKFKFFDYLNKIFVAKPKVSPE